MATHYIFVDCTYKISPEERKEYKISAKIKETTCMGINYRLSGSRKALTKWLNEKYSDDDGYFASLIKEKEKIYN